MLFVEKVIFPGFFFCIPAMPLICSFIYCFLRTDGSKSLFRSSLIFWQEYYFIGNDVNFLWQSIKRHIISASFFFFVIRLICECFRFLFNHFFINRQDTSRVFLLVLLINATITILTLSSLHACQEYFLKFPEVKLLSQ